MTLLWSIPAAQGDFSDESGPIVPSDQLHSAGTAETEDAVVLKEGAYLSIKLALEWMAAMILLIVLAPLLAGLALSVKLTSPGPVFYSQIRLGRSGRLFRIYKIRTMAHNCEATTGPVWAAVEDPRVTRVGRWLRDTHLDEIPQLFNILRGEMSLVGPRPERPEIAARIVSTLPEFADRLLVRPGLTGLAQIRMPADTDFRALHRKLGHDLHYIRNISLAMDARIVFATMSLFLCSVATALSQRLFRSDAVCELDNSPSLVLDAASSMNDVVNIEQRRAA